MKFGLLHEYTQKNTLFNAEKNLGRKKNSLFLRVGLLKPLKSLPPDFRVNQFKDR